MSEQQQMLRVIVFSHFQSYYLPSKTFRAAQNKSRNVRPLSYFPHSFFLRIEQSQQQQSSCCGNISILTFLPLRAGARLPNALPPKLFLLDTRSLLFSSTSQTEESDSVHIVWKWSEIIKCRFNKHTAEAPCFKLLFLSEKKSALLLMFPCKLYYLSTLCLELTSVRLFL